MKRFIVPLVPAGFRGQVAGILLAGLVLSQTLAAMLYMVLLPQWQRVLRPEAAVTRMDMAVRLLESVPQADRESFAQRLYSGDFQIRYDSAGLLATSGPGAEAADADLGRQLSLKLGRPPGQVQVGPAPGHDAQQLKRIEVVLRGGGLLSVVTPIGQEHRLGLVEQAGIVAFFLFAMGGLWAWLTWMVNAPLMRFALAAERVGLDVGAPPFPEQGPAQLQRAIRAFNQMQVRLQRLLTDRTRMLGAISHDLRTPLTRLRLRLETGRATDDMSKMVTDIDAMEAMLTSTLSFVRGVDDVETAEAVDLDLLLQTVCDMVSDVGGEVSYVSPGRCRFQCKPQALMRALTNVVGNAAKYGHHVHVALRRMPTVGFLVEVEDDGPGIPDGEKARVFEPFYRTAAARDRDSEGMGLGLSIARSVILAHGGAIELRDARPHGLLVVIALPEGPVT